MKIIFKIFILISIFFLIISCKKTNNQTQNQQNTVTFKIIPEFENQYSASNVKPITNLNVESAISIYIQHLKEQIDWNKRINYEINKKKFQNRQNNAPNVNENSGDSDSNEYGTLFNQKKEQYEKIFFKAIGITQEKWEEFSTKYYKEILNYRQSNPQIEQEIVKYSKLVQEQQRMLNEE